MKRKSVTKQDPGNNNKAKVDKKLQKTCTTDTGSTLVSYGVTVELEFGGMF
jgi:hypothetical protein